jgi:hypothetical protein
MRRIYDGHATYIEMLNYRRVQMRHALILTLALLVSSCSTLSPVCDVPRAPENESAKIVVYRPAAFVGAVYSTPMSIDNCKVGSLGSGAYVVYHLPEGIHRIAVEKRALELGAGANIKQLFEIGKTYYLLQNVSFAASLVLVEADQAFREMPELKEI